MYLPHLFPSGRPSDCVVAPIAGVGECWRVTTQVTRPPLPTGSSSAAPTAHGAVPVRVSPVAAESEEPTSHRGPVHATFGSPGGVVSAGCDGDGIALTSAAPADRKSTRLNSSH